ncbi:RND efflux system, inner membrane transporter CmeB [Cronobacter sakazakii 680]|nr:RND efflux system, inner membrane transporter CmeB [Cronobacter sakazakii 680]
MANFFIQRPIFAWVLAIIMMMAGALAILQLPSPSTRPSLHRPSPSQPPIRAQTRRRYRTP